MRTSRGFVTVLAGLLLACAPTRPSTPPQPAPVAARRRATTEIDNLVAFARLYGYIRFFHPTKASHDADWTQLAIAGVQQVRDAPTTGALADALEQLFRPYAPSMQLWVHGEPVPAPPRAPARRDGLVYWQYQGFPGTRVSLHNPPYAMVRVHPEERWRRRFAEPPADTRIQAVLAPKLEMRLPVVLDADQAAKTIDSYSPDYVDPLDHGSPAVRAAAVIEVWNVLRHFYPYQHELELDWPAILAGALRAAQDDRDVDDMRETLRALLEPLQDGHGYVGHRRHSRQATVPVRVELIEGQPVVTGIRDDDRFAVGDVLEDIDGAPALPRIREIADRLSGTRQWREFRAAAWEALQVEPGESLLLTLERDGQHRKVQAEAARAEVPQSPRPAIVHTFDDGVVYVDLTRAEWPQIEPHLAALAAAPGVVFDLRGYPKDNGTIVDHLLQQPEDALWMHVPRFVEPDGRVVGWYDIGWHRRPRSPHIGGAVTFLISGEAISYAESLLSYVEAHQLGTLVGTTTAGANGDIVRFDTMAGFYVIFSGMRVTRHDGSPFHGGGVRPDIEVHRTIAGLRAGRDEVLEAGLASVRSAMIVLDPASPAGGE